MRQAAAEGSAGARLEAVGAVVLDRTASLPALLAELDRAASAGSSTSELVQRCLRHVQAGLYVAVQGLPVLGLAVHAVRTDGEGVPGAGAGSSDEEPPALLAWTGTGREPGLGAAAAARVLASRCPVPLEGAASAEGTGPEVTATRWGLPLRAAGESLGVLSLSLSAPAAWAEVRSESLTLLTLALASAVQREQTALERRQYRVATRARRQLLEEGSRAVTVQQAARVLAAAAARAFQTERAGLYVVDQQGVISHAVGVGVSPELSALLATSLVGKQARGSPVWRSAEDALGPVVVSDASTVAQRRGGFSDAMGFASYVAIPLLSAAGPLGLVMVGDTTRRRTWTAFERDLARQLALEGALVMDSARLRQAERAQLREATYRACHDGLTGLPNREVLLERLGQLVRQVPRPGIALLLLDLNGFKQVNDALGHATGDLLLTAVAGRLSYLVDVDVVARLGGDEFGLVVSGPDAGARAEALAQQVRAGLDEPFALDGRQLHVTGSIGIAVAPDDAADVGALLQAADVAMYAAKRQGSGPVRYRPEMEAPALEALVVYSELHQAVRDDELRLHYQPKVDLRTGLVYGVEALVRWQHPRRGLLSPAAFLPVAEATDLIHPLTTWVLRAAVAQWRTWRGEGRRLDLAVNVSVLNLSEPAFSVLLDALVLDVELARALVLEITETAVMTDHREATALLQRLRDHGVRISMDDFGTGQSSLTQLRRLPVDELKIDQELVRRIGSDRVDRAMVETIVRLAQHLRLDVVAEGVEDADALAVLLSLGCHAAQGYHLSPPMPAAELDLDRRYC